MSLAAHGILMKIMTFNIRHGGGTREKEILESVLKNSPDTVIFSECRENKNGHFLRKSLFEKGYISFSSSSIYPKENAVAIASQKPFVTTTFPLELNEHSQRRAIALKFSHPPRIFNR